MASTSGQRSGAFAHRNNADQSRNPARESTSWAGMMMSNNLSDDESDSDDSENGERAGSMPQKGNSIANMSQSTSSGSGNAARTSWSQRAAAVGSRPPDTASQNPPTLKILGLKSVRDGGLPLGGNGMDQPPMSPAVSMRQQVERRQQEEQAQRNRTLLVEQQREAARNRTPSPAFELVEDRKARPPAQNDQILHAQRSVDDEVGRHGSMINFGGTDGFGDDAGGASRSAQQPDGQMRAPRQATLDPPRNPYDDQPLTPRTQLTKQLGLGARSSNDAVREPLRNPHANEPSTQRNALTQQLGLASGVAQPRAPGPMAYSQSSHGHSPTRSLMTASGSASSSGSAHSPPQGPAQMRGVPQSLVAGRQASNGVPLQRGPPPAMQVGPGGQRAGAPAPQALALPSPVHMPPSARNGPPIGGGPQRGPSGGFSDGPYERGNGAPARRPSLFRRSKAFLMGDAAPGGGVGGFAPPRQGGGGGMANGQGPQRRQSLFRRSMAMFTGRGPTPAARQAQQQHDLDDDSNAPAPRVQGFIEEKPKDRKSQYLGGGGMGDEWDFNGFGAHFWKRFSVAQHKLQDGEFKDGDLLRQKNDRRRRATKIASLLGGVIIILAVVAIIIWRENVKTSDIPGAIDRQNGGAGTDLDQSLSKDESVQSTAAAATAGSNVATAAAPRATADDGTTASTTTTTKKKKKSSKKKKKKSKNDERRKRDNDDDDGDDDDDEREAYLVEDEDGVSTAERIRRDVELSFSSSDRSVALPLDRRHSVPSSQSNSQTMIRRRRHHVIAFGQS